MTVPLSAASPTTYQTCRYMTCQSKARGLVRIRGLLTVDDHGVHAKIDAEVPMCAECADLLDLAVHRGRPLHMTPGQLVYVGPLDAYVRKP